MEKKYKTIYEVQAHESIYDVASKFELSIFEIKSENQDVDDWYEGKLLFIPAKKNYYIVKPLDNLDKIAKQLGVSKDRLISLNSCKNLFIGQRLLY